MILITGFLDSLMNPNCAARYMMSMAEVVSGFILTDVIVIIRCSLIAEKSLDCQM